MPHPVLHCKDIEKNLNEAFGISRLCPSQAEVIRSVQGRDTGSDADRERRSDPEFIADLHGISIDLFVLKFGRYCGNPDRKSYTPLLWVALWITRSCNP